jgi:AcrR family transcriptional regulator
MPRPSQTDEQRRKLLPIICQVFSDLGYRRTTTAELAERCGVRENILYRLWPDKKAMFLAAIDDIFRRRAETWGLIVGDRSHPEQAAARLVAYEAKHQGEFGFYRVVFTGLAETDDVDMRSALTDMYRRFQRLVKRHVEESRTGEERSFGLSAEASAWGFIGLATVSNIVRELELLRPREREQMFAAVAKHLMEGTVG